MRTTETGAVIKLLCLIECRIPGAHKITYLERMLERIIESEFLLGKFLDKMMPTLTPEQTTMVMNSFETKILALQAGPGTLAAPVPATSFPVPPTIELEAAGV